MKILLPTDFSENAQQALDFALYLLQHTGGEIMLLYAYKVQASSGMFISVERIMKEDAEKDMDALIRQYEPSLPDNIELDFRILRGDSVHTIARMGEQDYDLILMGTTGASGIDEVFLGSTTGGVIKDTEAPVLAIPKNTQPSTIDRIVVAIDGQPYSSEKVFATVKKLADAFQSKVTGLYISADGSQPEEDIAAYLPEVDYETKVVKGDKVNSEINRFTMAHQAQMLVMVRRSRGFLGGLFHSSTTMKEAFDSPLPLLILQD